MTVRSKQIWLLIGILSLGTILRMYDLLGESLWVDEGFSVDISKHNISKIYLLTKRDVHPPFYYFVLHYWMGIWGDSESAVRTLSALFGIASILIFYKIGILIFNELTALIASSFAALSIFYIEYSQEARMYSLLLLLSLLSYYFYLRVLKDGRSVYYDSIILLWLNILLAYTHVYGLFVLLTQAVFSLIYWRRWNRFNRRTWVIIQILWGILYLPWVWALVIQVKRAVHMTGPFHHFGTKEFTSMEFVYAMVSITRGRISFLIFLILCIWAII